MTRSTTLVVVHISKLTVMSSEQHRSLEDISPRVLINPERVAIAQR